MNKGIIKQAGILYAVRRELSWLHIKWQIYRAVGIILMIEMFKYNLLLLIITGNNKFGEI